MYINTDEQLFSIWALMPLFKDPCFDMKREAFLTTILLDSRLYLNQTSHLFTLKYRYL